MATIKSYTDLEQSKKLEKILSLESADMFYIAGKGEPIFIGNKMVAYGEDDYDCLGEPDVLCWSLAALFKLLPNSAQLEKGNVTELYRVTLPVELKTSDWYIEPIDACVEMIEHLHGQKML